MNLEPDGQTFPGRVSCSARHPADADCGDFLGVKSYPATFVCLLAAAATLTPPALAAPPPAVSAEKNSYAEVTSRLDPGGRLFFYLSTESWLGALSETVNGFRDLALSGASTDVERANVNRGFDLARRLIQRSGVEQVSGVGISSLAREPGLFRDKTFLHRYPGQGDDALLWSAFGRAPHPLDALKLLPANTAAASFGDYDLARVWDAVRAEVAATGAPDWRAALDRLPVTFEAATGLKFDAVLASLDGPVGLVVTLDPTRKVAVPVGGAGSKETLEMPEPALALVLRVKDNLIFDRLDAVLGANPQSVRTDDPAQELRMRGTPAAPNPSGLPLRPTVARSGPYLILATTDALVREMTATLRGTQPGLPASSAEFQRLARELPTEGNSFQFVSRVFGETVANFQLAALRGGSPGMPAKAAGGGKSNAPDPAAFLAFYQKFGFGGAASQYAVGAQTPEGWFSVGQGNQDASRTVLAPLLVFPVALAAGVAVPGFLKARENSQLAVIRGNLSVLAAAKEQFVAVKNRPAGAPVRDADVAPFLKDGRPKPAAGERYQLNPVGQPPSATLSKAVGGQPAGTVLKAE